MCRLPELYKHVKILFPASSARHPSPTGNLSICHYRLLFLPPPHPPTPHSSRPPIPPVPLPPEEDPVRLDVV